MRLCLSGLERKLLRLLNCLDTDIDKPGACHFFRHTMATLMLDNGADIRFALGKHPH